MKVIPRAKPLSSQLPRRSKGLVMVQRQEERAKLSSYSYLCQYTTRLRGMIAVVIVKRIKARVVRLRVLALNLLQSRVFQLRQGRLGEDPKRSWWEGLDGA